MVDTYPLPRDLGDGLMLRRAQAADTEALAAFLGGIFDESGTNAPDPSMVAWTQDLMDPRHPTVAGSGFLLVEDTARAAIISALCLIPQTWTYGGIPFGVGRPELVGTHPDYRRRRLVRTQFEVLHAWCAARALPVQAIIGIPWYYRQFGYEMAPALYGGRTTYPSLVPKLPPGEVDPYHVRPVTPADLPTLTGIAEAGDRRYLLAARRDAALWDYELQGRAEKSSPRRALRVIETPAGAVIGFLAHVPTLWGTTLAVTAYELTPGTSWAAVTPVVLRYLAATGASYAAHEQKVLEAMSFVLGVEHPIYAAVPDRLPHSFKPTAWYMRVANLPGFLQHVAPVLEARLAASIVAGHTGEMQLNFYRGGLRLAFAGGRLIAAEPWAPETPMSGSAAFPELTFLQLLFGYRALGELEYAFADCWVRQPEARPVLDALFPKQASNVWGVA